MRIVYPEFVDNPESRCPVVLILDTSASMEGAPIEALNRGLAAFKYEVEQDDLAALRVDLAVVTFGQDVTVLHDFSSIDEFTAPKLEPKGRSPLGGAMESATQLLEERKKTYRAAGVQYYRPWMFLITDGAPTDGEKWVKAAEAIKQMEAQNKLSFFTIAVEGADMDILREIAPVARPPMALKDLRFEELFRWLSASVKRVSSGRVSQGDMMALPAVSGWAATDA